MRRKASAPIHRRPPRVAVAAAFAATGLLAAACSGSTNSSTGNGPKTRPVAHHSVGAVKVSISPGSGTRDANPSKGITVTATEGTLASVKVTGGADPVTGSMNASHTVWRSTWTLDISSHYTVTATATGHGKSVTKTSSFGTLTPASTFTTEIVEGYHQTYGVGMPIILYFNRAITNRAAVERALQIKTSKPVVGAWYWDSPCGMAVTCLYFRPRTYWPPHTTVSFTGHLNGVEGARGVFGYHTLTQTFSIGESLIVVASTANHHLNVYKNGKLFAHWPISTGRPGDNTPNGTYLTIEKHNPVDMKGPGYNIEVPWSVRFTWSGDYLHDAYWSVGEQGFTNVSHGCVNMHPAEAEVYYKMAVPGDPVTITGSPRPGQWDNGYTEWFLSWSQYLKGSALHEAVQAGPTGSKFVNPATLGPATATAPLGTAPTGNFYASG